MSVTSTLTIGFCGFGVMGSGLQKGISQTRKNCTFYAFDPAINSSKEKDITWLSSNVEVMRKRPNIVFICVKPQYFGKVCEEISVESIENIILVSVAAGVSTKQIESYFPNKKPRVIRCMPNIPCIVQEMASGICSGQFATKYDLELIRDILSPLGTCLMIGNEDLMHAVTGVSGSGPAYFFVIIEALADGGVKNGLPRDIALQLAIHTCKGAAEMLIQQKSTHPAILKDQVCSPGGTTIAAIAAMEAKGLRSCLIEGVTAATLRSRELSKL
jgi:pyrroline-5-carboxylate reductase